MRGMRSFDSVPTCSGWGFSHIGRFSPLRMTIRGERVVSRGGGFAAFLEEGILVSQPSPLGKVPEGRIGCYRMKDRWGKRSGGGT